jgi:hypothetical protein
MPLTRYEKAQKIAEQVIVLARKRDEPVSRALIEEAFRAAREQGLPQADATMQTAVSATRNLARALRLPVAIGPREIEYMWREVFKNLSSEQAFALREKLAEEQPGTVESEPFETAFSKVYFPKSCNAVWTKFPRALEIHGRRYAWEFITGTKSAEEYE